MSRSPSATLKMKISFRIALALRPCVLICLLGVLWTFGCRPADTTKAAPTVVRGAIDLRGWNFTKDGPLKLDGDWEFFPGVFVAPGDSVKAPGYLRLPGLWNGAVFRGRPLKGKGFGTYRLRILHDASPGVLALRMKETFSSYRLLINGNRIMNQGSPGASRAGTHPVYGPPKYAVFTPAGNTMVLILHIANFDHRIGGPKYSMELGGEPELRRRIANSLNFDVFLFGILLMLGIYNMVLFLVRRKEKSTLYFALFTFMYMIRTLVTGEMYLARLADGLPWEFQSKLIYLTGHLSALAFASFVYEIFNDIFSKLVLNFSRVFLGLMCAVVLVTPSRINTELFPWFEVYVVALTAYLTWIFVRAVFRGMDDAWIYLGGWVLLFVAITNDVLKNHEVIQSVYLMPAGIAVMVISQAVMLSRRFSRAFIASEKLSDILEDRIQRRTAQLAEARDAAESAHREIEHLNEFSTKLNTSADLDDVLEQVIQYIANHYDPDGTWLWLVDADDKELRSHRITYRYSNIPEETRRYLADLRLPLIPETGSLYYTWRRGRWLNVPRIRESVMTKTDKMIVDRLNLKGFLHMPLKVQGRVIGIFSLTRIDEKRFAREEIESIGRFCEQITGAVYSSSLLRQVREEREKAEASGKELAAARDRAEESNRAKTEFLTTMSHEIRTPLNSIIGTADLLRETNPRPDQTSLVDVLNRAGNNLLNLINELLDLARLEAGKLRMEREPFELEEVRRNIMSVLRVRAEAEGLELTWRDNEEVPVVLTGDAGRLEQVLLNLLGNAMKFTESGGVQVTVGVHERTADEIALKFAVSDTGVGIPEDKLDSIFERFTQVDSSITRKYGGTGLGLAICRRLVKLMGGRIWAESRTGVKSGSTFYFTSRFGIAPGTVKRTDVPDVEPADMPRGVRVLLAEDNPDNQYLVKAFLKNTGVVLEDAANGSIAVEMFREREYDLVLMDIQMPVMDGYTATRLIREYEDERNLAVVPIIALTAHAGPADIEKSLAAGCDGHLTKPIKKNILLNAIAAHVRNGSSTTRTGSV